MDTRALLKEIRLFVLDMDGTFYLGEQIIPGSLDFIEAVRRTGRQFLFFTNNSSRTPERYMDKLAGMGCPIARSQIMTSGDVTIRYLQTHCPGKRVYLMGTQALRESFLQAGIPLTQEEQPDIVVAAFDTELTYHKLERACTFLRRGARFLATHMDLNCPTADGFIPDCGAFCAAIQSSTGRTPQYLGKPSPETVDMILSATGFAREEVAFVGDRLYTDIATGVNNGALGLLVLSGETTREDLKGSPVQPHAVFQDLKELAGAL